MSKEKTNNSNDKKNVEKKETTAKKTSTKTAKKTSAKADKKVTKTKSKDTNKEIKKDKKIVEEKIIDEKIIDADIDEEYDEDLEDFINEDDEEEEVIKDKTPSKKKEVKKEDKPEPKKIKEAKKEKEDKNKEDKISKENIKKIEKLAKEKSKKNKKKANNYSKIKDFGYFLEKNRNVISSFIGGVLLTVLIVIIIWPSRIATLKNGTQPVVKVANKTYTADDLYTQMKNHYSVSQLLDQIDNDILTKMYPEDKKMTEEVESNAEYYINMYKQYYNYKEEEFLSANGFASRDAYLEYLKLDNRRKKYQNEENMQAINITIPHSNLQTVKYEYDANTKTYKRYARNKLQTDYITGEPVTTKNIIITMCDNYTLTDSENKGRQGLKNIGTFDGYYITNGQAIKIKCIKSDRKEQTVYKDLEGNEIDVNDGNTFINICPTDAKVVIE